MSGLIPDWLRHKPADIEASFYEAQKYKTHFSMLGPVGGGKTTIAAATVLTAETLSAQVGNFYCRVLPQSSHIIADANNLRVGRFPKKTDPFNPVPPEAGLMVCERGWRDKKVQQSVCDVGGEVFDHMLVDPRTALSQKRQLADRRVIDYVRDSQGFAVVLPAPKAILFRTSHEQHDPDEHVYRVLSQTLEWKRLNRREVKGIAVWLSQWDEAMDIAKDMGMDIYDPVEPQAALARFMDNGFPSVAMLLKPLEAAGKVKYFRSYFQIKKREDGVTDMTWEDDPKAKVIDVLDDPASYIRYKPKYSEQDYIDYIRWMGRFAD